MNDYQAIYDAVRSRISGGNVAEAVTQVARDAFDVSFAVDVVKNEMLTVAYEQQRPSVLFRPSLTQDGNAWLAIYGDLPTGVVGAGTSPSEAMADFDKAWSRNAAKQGEG
jgi:hypothetical protein